MPISLRTLYLVTAVLCNVQRSLEREIPRRSFLSRRAIDGTRGRKYFDPHEEGAFDSYGSAGGQYDPYDLATDLSDIRRNVPGEPGVNYPAYTTLPQTGFTCEGRSRGYYADEAAGCQVFHVCHDVLVSSFLCPIGSTFSQKLLTCDWWTKVDCSATSRYLGVNRDHYQIDDDEMIRNAYAMISLQSAEDVTKDGLVDPDSGTRIIDYAALNSRVADYTAGLRRITDYSSVDATSNDLPSGFEDYRHRGDARVLSYDRYQPRMAKTSPVYQSKFHFESKSRSPYHASPIIRHDYQERSGDNEYRDDYRKPDGYTNRLQASYAPTVPTVTTTTRRLYSPTVPTTYRPSTLAYGKLDLLMDSSDHLYAHSKSLASLTTPPTIRQSGETRNVESRASETGHGVPEKSESVLSPRTDTNDGKNVEARARDDEVRRGVKEKAETSFRINVTVAIDEDEIFRQQNDKPVIGDDSADERAVDIETRDSIGIARALNDSPDRIIVQRQDPVERVLKDERRGTIALSPLHASSNYFAESYGEARAANSTRISKKPNVLAVSGTIDDRSTEEIIVSTTARSLEGTTYARNFDDVTSGNRRRKGNVPFRSSTVSVTATNATERSVDRTHSKIANRSALNDNQTSVDQSSSSTKSVSSFSDESASSGLRFVFGIPQPVPFLEPPPIFFINVPKEMRYTTIDEIAGTSWGSGTATTETPRFSGTTADVRGASNARGPARNGNTDGRSPIDDYGDDGVPKASNPRDRPTVEVSTVPPVPRFVSSWRDRPIVSVPATDIVPPIVDYNDGFDDFVPPARDASGHAARFDPTEVESPEARDAPTISKTDSETEILNRYNTGFQFTIRDAINVQSESTIDARSPCRSSTLGEQTGPCESSSSVASEIAVSTPDVREKTISIGVKATTEQPVSSNNLRSTENSVTPVPNEFSASTTQSSFTINSYVGAERSIPRTLTLIDAPEITGLEKETAVTTASSLSRMIRPGSLKQLEKTIERVHNSPYEITLSKENLGTTAADFRHQRPTSVLNEQLRDFEIVKSVEPVSPKFFNASHAFSSRANSSYSVAWNDTTGRVEVPDTNISMLSLVQLMAELLKLDRLPRPFSAKDLRNVELETSLDLDLDEPPFDTANPLLIDRSQEGTPFVNADSEASVLDTPADVVRPKTSFNLDRSSPSLVTTNPLLDSSQTATPFASVDSVPSFDDVSKARFDVPSATSPDGATESTKSRSKAESKTIRPFEKHEILEQLTENFGQPLYRAIHGALVFDLPQVQRNLDFESGLLIEQSEHAIGEVEEKDSVSSTVRPTTTTTTTAETEKTIVETEFVSSIGFSFDTNEGREKYVEAVLEGLLDDRVRDGDKKESGVAQLIDTTPKNETLRSEEHGEVSKIA